VIVYSLSCAKGHAFEGWFSGSAGFDQQQKAGKLICPICDSRKIQKAPMAPALGATVGEKRAAGDEMRKARQFVTGLRKHIEENAEYVGPKFPNEARKIHYGESEERHIYGEATVKEAQELIEEGVDVAPLPPDLSEAN
jgi:hypothetical protein